VAVPTTGPSVPPAPRTRTHVQEGVENRARIREPKEEEKNVQTDRDVSPPPNYLRPCVGLDVHKGSITATRMEPGGKVSKTWTFATTRPEIQSLAATIPASLPVVLEASTAGKAVAMILNEVGCELHMAAPNKIPKPQVKTDKRDSIRLAHLYQSGSMPECYVPPPDIEHLRLLTRNRRDLAAKVTLVKNQVHSLVTRNLADSEMKGITDWFGVAGLRKLVRLPLAAEDRAHLARYLEQLELLAHQEESMQAELAQVARDRPEISLLMTVPGVNFYTAVGIVAEIGDVHRFPDKQHLASYAGLVPRADDSGEAKAHHGPVKKGNFVLKSFPCTAVRGMMRANQTTAVTEFYRKKAKSHPRQQAQVAAARKLSAEVWKILTFGVPYREEDADLTQRKEERMLKIAEGSDPETSVPDLELLAYRLSGKADVLERLQDEAGDEDSEVDNAG
jgi:transposase